jgi:hypothetical protein
VDGGPVAGLGQTPIGVAGTALRTPAPSAPPIRALVPGAPPPAGQPPAIRAQTDVANAGRPDTAGRAVPHGEDAKAGVKAQPRREAPPTEPENEATISEGVRPEDASTLDRPFVRLGQQDRPTRHAVDARHRIDERAAPATDTSDRPGPDAGGGPRALEPKPMVERPTREPFAREEAAPTVHVSIGRIEVRAVPAAAERAELAPTPPNHPPLALEEYLRRRNEGRHG